jgi:nucleotide-binding universal stress UspA family protein
MKTILVPFEESDVVNSVLESACQTAKRFGSYVEGVYVQPALPAIASADGFGVVTPAFVEKYELEDRQRIQDAEKYFNNFDLIVVGRPLQGAPVPSMHTLESALFESGRPILITPPAPPKSMGESIVISWNGSTETARTISFAMPFLQQAAKVSVVSIVDDMVPGPSGQDIVRHLRRNGIPATAVDAKLNKRDIGEAMLGEAMVQGADLIVKGAYTHSRLRQMIFGGATSYMLANTEVPIIMAH